MASPGAFPSRGGEAPVGLGVAARARGVTSDLRSAFARDELATSVLLLPVELAGSLAAWNTPRRAGLAVGEAAARSSWLLRAGCAGWDGPGRALGTCSAVSVNPYNPQFRLPQISCDSWRAVRLLRSSLRRGRVPSFCPRRGRWLGTTIGETGRCLDDGSRLRAVSIRCNLLALLPRELPRHSTLDSVAVMPCRLSAEDGLDCIALDPALLKALRRALLEASAIFKQCKCFRSYVERAPEAGRRVLK